MSKDNSEDEGVVGRRDMSEELRSARWRLVVPLEKDCEDLIEQAIEDPTRFYITDRGQLH